jgi:hypothetical protein
MASPTYTWEFNCDLFGGNRVPTVATFEATSGMYCKVGTLMSMVSGQVLPTTDGTGDKAFGLAQEVIDVAANAADPVKIAVLFPGAVIKGTADADASSVAGFTSKAIDLNSDGTLDHDDTTGGGLSVWRTEDSGLTVYAIVTVGAIIG